MAPRDTSRRRWRGPIASDYKIWYLLFERPNPNKYFEGVYEERGTRNEERGTRNEERGTRNELAAEQKLLFKLTEIDKKLHHVRQKQILFPTVLLLS
jgi:hypothetical protein